MIHTSVQTTIHRRPRHPEAGANDQPHRAIPACVLLLALTLSFLGASLPAPSFATEPIPARPATATGDLDDPPAHDCRQGWRRFGVTPGRCRGPDGRSGRLPPWKAARNGVSRGANDPPDAVRGFLDLLQRGSPVNANLPGDDVATAADDLPDASCGATPLATPTSTAPTPGTRAAKANPVDLARLASAAALVRFMASATAVVPRPVPSPTPKRTFTPLDEIELARQAVASEPHSAAMQYNLGLLLDTRKRHKEAISAYEAAVRLDPNHFEAWSRLGLTEGRLRRYPQSVAALKRAVKIKPGDAEAWYNLGVSLNNARRPAEAMQAYRASLKLEPNNPDGWYNLGNAAIELRQYDDAADALQQALVLTPDDASTHYLLGLAEARRGNASAARKQVSILEGLDPGRAARLKAKIGTASATSSPSGTAPGKRPAVRPSRTTPGQPPATSPSRPVPDRRNGTPPDFRRMLEIFKRMPFGGTR